MLCEAYTPFQHVRTVLIFQSESKFIREIFSLQAKQVFYAIENDTSNWYVVLKATSKGFHDLAIYDENYDDILVSNEYMHSMVEDADETNELTYARQDCEDVFILRSSLMHYISICLYDYFVLKTSIL